VHYCLYFLVNNSIKCTVWTTQWHFLLNFSFIIQLLDANFEVSWSAITYAKLLFTSTAKMLIQLRDLAYWKRPSVFKRENQQNAPVLGCEQCKDHYVANPFTFLGASTNAWTQQQKISRSLHSTSLFAPLHSSLHVILHSISFFTPLRSSFHFNLHSTSIFTPLHSSLHFTLHSTSLLIPFHSSLHFTIHSTSLFTPLHSSLYIIPTHINVVSIYTEQVICMAFLLLQPNKATCHCIFLACCPQQNKISANVCL
jgi:hypothetical protein